MQPLAYTLQDAEGITGLGRTKLYELIGSEVLDARKAGSRTLITGDSLRSYVSSLPKATINASQRKVAA